MTDYFPRGDPVWLSPAPEHVSAVTVSRIISSAIVTVAATVPTWIFAGWRWAVPVMVTLIVFFAWRLVRARAWCRAYRFALTEHSLLVSEGLMFRSLATIPYGRIQTVSVEEGPIDRRWNLSNISVKTAADSDGSIPGLKLDDAVALRDELMELSQRHAIAL